MFARHSVMSAQYLLPDLVRGGSLSAAKRRVAIGTHFGVQFDCPIAVGAQTLRLFGFHPALEQFPQGEVANAS